ncbi:exodeoxyribonuclease V subunit gamma [Borrelia miyamotoi]|uniref:Exodeoxyribonuclease V subunit gamma n=1 Tax=Borrelia miyamotoi TaxID=47466 RepID=A0AAQ2X0D9_9SPIR|nr:exodeoxyribonuclease V subunit gamma [Borrelia miyamotoi]AGT27576.1 exodeoxyribonuclease V subunit gamma [Borrelia miyamotoi LB-2001]AJA58748.1 exodeoxyribonuclease V subunit gamma [Borrelia miyamotoi]AOW95831.1 exodeoxyribonuclease V subunit gamma [Borrelia miyamotoi]QTL83721.1 exodeoxyribonuclease V subunit gamma [Borrelia miyamotoi]WAZ84974.1 exodeoxyribonuclease V subunit gamma [Borrelia miyamotoi]
MYKIYKTNKVSKIYNKIKELTRNDDIFKKETIIIVKNNILSEEIKKYIANMNEVSYNLNIKQNIMKTIYKLSIKNHNIKSFLENNTLLLYSETEKFILYHILKDNKIKNIKEFKSTKNRYIFSLKIINLFHKYNSKFSNLIENWRQNKLLFKDKNKNHNELMQKEMFEKLFENQINIFDLQEKIEKETTKTQQSIETKRIIIIEETREIDRKILYCLQKIFDITVYELILEDITQIKSTLIEELVPIKFQKCNSNMQIEQEIDIQSFKEKNFLASFKNNIIKDTPLLNLDNSFKIIEAKTKKREVEILVNNILHSTQNNNLKINDIVITYLSKDMDMYLPYIEEFLNKYEIEFNILDSKDISKSQSVTALKQLMQLFISYKGSISNFNKKEIIEFLSNTKVMNKFNISISELEYLIKFSDAVNINFGMNDTHKESLSYDKNFLNSWEDGFNRFLTSEIFNEKYECKNCQEVISFQDSDSIISLISIIRSLYEDIMYFKGQEYTIYEWAEIIDIFIDKYIKIENDNKIDEYIKTRIQYLKNFSRDFNDNLHKDYMEKVKGRKVEFALFKIMLEESLEQKSYQLNNQNTGILVASSDKIEYLQKSEIHFLGANELDSNIYFDNMNLLNEYYDHVNMEQDNISNLIKIIFAASNKFYFYYSTSESLNPESNKPKIINKIVNHIKNMGEEIKIEIHPIENYNFEYFKQEKDDYLINYDTEAFNIATLLQKNNHSKFKQKRIKLKKQITLEIEDINKAMNNPYKYFYEEILNVYIKDISQISEIKENQEEQIIDIDNFNYKLMNNLIPIHECIRDAINENHILEIIDVIIENQIQKGIIPINIKKATVKEKFILKFNEIKNNITINFQEFFKMKKADIILNKNIPINFEGETLEFKLKGKLKNIYKIDNQYYYINLEKQDYSQDKIIRKINLYIMGLILKSEIENIDSIQEIRILYENSKISLDNKYINKIINSSDLVNLLKQIAYISSYPTPIYKDLIQKSLIKTKNINEFPTILITQIKSLKKSININKAMEFILKQKDITWCPYYNRFKDTHDLNIDKNLENLLQNFYAKFI